MAIYPYIPVLYYWRLVYGFLPGEANHFIFFVPLGAVHASRAPDLAVHEDVALHRRSWGIVQSDRREV